MQDLHVLFLYYHRKEMHIYDVSTYSSYCTFYLFIYFLNKRGSVIFSYIIILCMFLFLFTVKIFVATPTRLIYRAPRSINFLRDAKSKNISNDFQIFICHSH
jgi:hypothetical protein